MLTALGIFLGYSVAAILGARYEVYQTMLANERSKFMGTQLEAKLYSKSDLVRIANKSPDFVNNAGYRYRTIGKDDVPGSDYTRVVLAGIFWWAFLVGGTVKALVMNGHKKTPGQREADLKAREEAAKIEEARLAELQKNYDEELDRKLREAGIEDV